MMIKGGDAERYRTGDRYNLKKLYSKGGKTMLEDLKNKFDNLRDEEKIEFMKLIMPSIREIFTRNSEKMMTEMMPLCGEMMKSCGMDMQAMMKIMGMMGKQKA